MRRVTSVGMVCFVCLVATEGRADETTPPPAAAPPPSSVRLDVGAGTYFPLMVGAEGTLELPYRVLLQADLGWMPGPYSNTIIGLLGDFGAINSFEQSLIEDALQNSFVGRLSLGWRPFSSLGLEAFAGYTLLTAGGSLSATDVIDSYLQSKGSSDRYGSLTTAAIPLRATLQSFHATVDWRFLFLSDHLVLRASLGYLQCFASTTSVSGSAPRPAGQAALTKLNSDLEGFLNPYFTEYVKAPLIGLNAAYRF